MTGKLAPGLSSLKKLEGALPQPKLCDVHRALFESHLSYANVVWGSLSSVDLKTPQRLQNRTLSIIESARYKDLRLKNWLNVDNLILLDQQHFLFSFSTNQRQNTTRYNANCRHFNTGWKWGLHQQSHKETRFASTFQCPTRLIGSERYFDRNSARVFLDW